MVTSLTLWDVPGTLEGLRRKPKGRSVQATAPRSSLCTDSQVTTGDESFLLPWYRLGPAAVFEPLLHHCPSGLLAPMEPRMQ